VTALHVFDMDGTLLRGTTASVEIARQLDCEAELFDLEAAFATGTVDTRQFAAELWRIWAALTTDQAAAAFDLAPWIDGLPDVLADIRRRGEHSVVVTMSPNFFAELLLDRGVDEVVASAFPPLPFRAPLEPAGILTPQDKVHAVRRVRARLGIENERCIAYGDSGSDVPLFKELRNTVAVNAGPTLRSLARWRYDGDDLRVAYAIAQSHLARRGSARVETAE
jgi:phosphoserine phosphatase